MRARALATTALVLALAGLAAPHALAGLADAETFLLDTTGSVSIEARYADGVGSTRMGFIQVEGATGDSNERLKPTPTCTEWIGTFTQVLVDARTTQGATSATLRIDDAVLAWPPTAAATRDAPGFTFDAVGTSGAFLGSLFVCDEPTGEGLVKFQAKIVESPLVDANAGTLRITPEGSP